jgi:hypothetical protein
LQREQTRCDRFRQSILKWAFEGRLADQDPTDEPASVLLERIRAERAAATAEKSGRRPSVSVNQGGRQPGKGRRGVTGGPLPHGEHAVVPEQKVVAYLLSETHPDGRGKARFFTAHGFSPADWEALADALRNHAMANLVVEAVETAFGVRYVVEGGLMAPDGRTPGVRTVWFIRTGRDVPELVTAYPMKRRS